MDCNTCDLPKDAAATLNVGPVVSGDEWMGRQFTVWVHNPDFNKALARTDSDYVNDPSKPPPGSGSNPRLISASSAFTPLIRVRMQVHTSAEDLDTLLTLDSDNSAITIDDADEWVFTILPVSLTLAKGSYFMAISCVRQGGGIHTFFKGTLTLTGKGVLFP